MKASGSKIGTHITLPPINTKLSYQKYFLTKMTIKDTNQQSALRRIL